MKTRRRGAQGGTPVTPANPPQRNDDDLFAAIHAMANAIRETATATTQAVYRLGKHNGRRDGHRNRDQEGKLSRNIEVDVVERGGPMTLATSLKVNPPKFKGTTKVNKCRLIEERDKKIAVSQVSHSGPSLQNYNRFTTIRRKNFKPNYPWRFQSNRTAPAHPLEGNRGRLRQDVKQDAGKQPQIISPRPICNRCGKDHGDRVCYFGTNACYNCGELGHFSRNCNKRNAQGFTKPQQQGRMFDMTLDDGTCHDFPTPGNYNFKT